MSDFKFGDILRYPDDQGVGDDILFAHLATVEYGGMEYQQVMVLRTTPDDDQWETGSIILAGRDELIPYVEPWPGLKVMHDVTITVDGVDVTDHAVFIDPNAIQLPGRYADGIIEIDYGSDGIWVDAKP